MTRFGYLIFGLAFLSFAPVQAQYYGNFGFPSPTLNIFTNQVGNEAFRQSVINPDKGGPDTSAPDQATVIPVANPATLRFTPSLPQRQRNLTEFVSSAEKERPGAGASLQAFLNAGDPVTVTSGVMTPLGLRTDNLADVMTFYMFSNWMAVNAATSMPSSLQIAGLRKQVERGLLASRQFDRAPNTEKQKAAESMMVSGLLTIAALAGAQGNAEATNAVSDRAAQNVKVIGLDLKTVELGPNGFEVVR